MACLFFLWYSDEIAYESQLIWYQRGLFCGFVSILLPLTFSCRSAGQTHSEADAQWSNCSVCELAPAERTPCCNRTLKQQLRWRVSWRCLCMVQSSVVFTTHRTMLTLCVPATGQVQSAPVIVWMSASWWCSRSRLVSKRRQVSAATRPQSVF